jgi:hypothetical protein
MKYAFFLLMTALLSSCGTPLEPFFTGVSPQDTPSAQQSPVEPSPSPSPEPSVSPTPTPEPSPEFSLPSPAPSPVTPTPTPAPFELPTESTQKEVPKAVQNSQSKLLGIFQALSKKPGNYTCSRREKVNVLEDETVYYFYRSDVLTRLPDGTITAEGRVDSLNLIEDAQSNKKAQELLLTRTRQLSLCVQNLKEAETAGFSLRSFPKFSFISPCFFDTVISEISEI